MIHIFNQGNPSDSKSIELSTKSGVWIPNEKRQELLPEAIEVIHIGRIFGNAPPAEDGEIERIVLSKWGEDGEYFHKIKDLPEALQFDDWEVWTERRDDP